MTSSTPTLSHLADDARARVGLSRPQMDRLLARYGLDDDRTVTARDYERFIQKLTREHDRFLRQVISRATEVAEANDPADPWLLTGEVSEITGMGEFQVANLRRRGKLDSYVPEGQRYPRYRLSALLAFIHSKPNYREHHNPLSWEFVRSFESRNPAPAPESPSTAAEGADAPELDERVLASTSA